MDESSEGVSEKVSLQQGEAPGPLARPSSAPGIRSLCVPPGALLYSAHLYPRGQRLVIVTLASPRPFVFFSVISLAL